MKFGNYIRDKFCYFYGYIMLDQSTVHSDTLWRKKENGKIEFIDTAIEVEKREKNEKRFFKLLGGK